MRFLYIHSISSFENTFLQVGCSRSMLAPFQILLFFLQLEFFYIEKAAFKSKFIGMTGFGVTVVAVLATPSTPPALAVGGIRAA